MPRRGITKAVLSILLLLLSGATFLGTVRAQNVAHLNVTVNGNQNLQGGFTNTVNLTITNNYFTSIPPSAAIYDVDVAVTVPSTLTLTGDSHWHYDSIALGQTVAITLQVFAPSSSIGNSSQGSVTISYKQLGQVTYTTETHTISFTVYGWINVLLYGVQPSPPITVPGGNATITGNILNSGNLAAYDANITIDPRVLAPGSPTSTFIGEIDPNIPRPFSLIVNLNRDVKPGILTIPVSAVAIDPNNPNKPYIAHQVVTIQIQQPQPVTPVSQQRQRGPVAVVVNILRYLYGVFFGSLTMLSYPTYNFDAFSLIFQGCYGIHF